MAYCSNCGTQLPNDANFCPKCGIKTLKGKDSKVLYPSDQLTDAFYNVGLELEKAFNTAARETHAAIQRAFASETVTCPKCNSKNAAGAIFCNNCGARIAPVEESHGGGV